MSFHNIFFCVCGKVHIIWRYKIYYSKASYFPAADSETGRKSKYDIECFNCILGKNKSTDSAGGSIVCV